MSTTVGPKKAAPVSSPTAGNGVKKTAVIAGASSGVKKTLTTATAATRSATSLSTSATSSTTPKAAATSKTTQAATTKPTAPKPAVTKPATTTATAPSSAATTTSSTTIAAPKPKPLTINTTNSATASKNKLTSPTAAKPSATSPVKKLAVGLRSPGAAASTSANKPVTPSASSTAPAPSPSNAAKPVSKSAANTPVLGTKTLKPVGVRKPATGLLPTRTINTKVKSSVDDSTPLSPTSAAHQVAEKAFEASIAQLAPRVQEKLKAEHEVQNKKEALAREERAKAAAVEEAKAAELAQRAAEEERAAEEAKRLAAEKEAAEDRKTEEMMEQVLAARGIVRPEHVDQYDHDILMQERARRAAEEKERQAEEKERQAEARAIQRRRATMGDVDEITAAMNKITIQKANMLLKAPEAQSRSRSRPHSPTGGSGHSRQPSKSSSTANSKRGSRASSPGRKSRPSSSDAHHRKSSKNLAVNFAAADDDDDSEPVKSHTSDGGVRHKKQVSLKVEPEDLALAKVHQPSGTPTAPSEPIIIATAVSSTSTDSNDDAAKKRKARRMSMPKMKVVNDKFTIAGGHDEDDHHLLKYGGEFFTQLDTMNQLIKDAKSVAAQPVPVSARGAAQQASLEEFQREYNDKLADARQIVANGRNAVDANGNVITTARFEEAEKFIQEDARRTQATAVNI